MSPTQQWIVFSVLLFIGLVLCPLYLWRSINQQDAEELSFLLAEGSEFDFETSNSSDWDEDMPQADCD